MDEIIIMNIPAAKILWPIFSDLMFASLFLAPTGNGRRGFPRRKSGLPAIRSKSANDRLWRCYSGPSGPPSHYRSH